MNESDLVLDRSRKYIRCDSNNEKPLTQSELRDMISVHVKRKKEERKNICKEVGNE